jgi:hypothetical protein
LRAIIKEAVAVEVAAEEEAEVPSEEAIVEDSTKDHHLT